MSAFAVDPATGALTFLDQVASGGTGTCYVRSDHAGRNLLLANFGSGSVAVLPVNPGGSLRPASAFVQDAGHGPNPRQAGPHAHSFNVSPDDRFAVEAEFGTDQLVVYRLDAAAGTLRPADPPFVAMAPASAPRHFTFHPNGRIAYALGEIDSSITVLAYAATAGRFRILQTVSTLPDDFKGKNTAAEVIVDPSGRWLYASNRGLNSIAVFAIGGDGRLAGQGAGALRRQDPPRLLPRPAGRLAPDGEPGHAQRGRLRRRSGHGHPGGHGRDGRGPLGGLRAVSPAALNGRV